jgi:His-Xaa-Ser system radical SAM maturase HxsC
MIDLSTYGRPLNLASSIVARVTLQDAAVDQRHDLVLVTGSRPGDWAAGYRAVVTTAPVSPHELPTQIPCIHSVRQISHLHSGDVVALHPRSGHVRTLFRPESEHNALLVTERCNSFCLMCSQPPIDRDDSGLVDLNLEAIRLMQPPPVTLGITGGEPTLLGADLFRIFEAIRTRLPETDIHMLTNGRRFAWPEFTQAFIEARPPRLTLGIPLYSDTAPEHDYVVQARGAFDQTVQGLHQLARYEQPVEIRIVVHALTAPHLKDLAEYIYRNLPFVAHVAFMGLEITGFARPNLSKLWIDPYDYQSELTAAVEYLAVRGMNVSIYNHQLCVLPQSLWRFARRSISDWKNVYLPECQSCVVRRECGGLFKSGLLRPSLHIRAIEAAVTLGE